MWYVGHWGFQHYCERAGMRPLVPGETLARAGDFVVLPVYPDDGFHRPHAGFAFVEPVWVGDVVAENREPRPARTRDANPAAVGARGRRRGCPGR